MSYLQLPIRNGGIISKASEWLLNMDTELVDGENKLNLIRLSSIEGIWSYLLGNTFKVNDNRDVLNKDRDWVWLCENTKIDIISAPFSTIFFARKDLDNNKNQYTLNPSVNLKGKSIQEADPSIKLLLPVIEKMTDSKDLGMIYDFFSSKEHRVKVEDKSSLDRPFIDDLSDDSKMAIAMKAYIRNVFDETNYDKPVYIRAIELVRNTIEEYKTNIKFRIDFKASKSAKFSCFTSSLSQPRHWLDPQSQSFVRGEPKTIINIDFDLIIDVLPEKSLVTRLLNGPMIASWGEGGFGILKYSENNDLPSVTNGDAKLLSYKDLRLLGLKLKKQTWEQKIE